MTRTICPQVSGIYGNNNADETTDLYPCLLIKNDEPQRELVITDAFKCSQQGEIDPDHPLPVHCVASDFGDYIAQYTQLRPLDQALYDAFDLVWQLACGNCLDNEHDPNNLEEDEDLVNECTRQRAALNKVHDYLINHPLVD